jgi:hypothetical protein
MPSSTDKGLATRNVDKPLPATPQSSADPIGHGTALAPAPAQTEERPLFVRMGWRLKLREKFSKSSRNKRLTEEWRKVQAIAGQPEQPAEEVDEPPSLPGAGLTRLKEQDEKPLPPSPVDETDPNLTRGDNDDGILALPPMPGHHRRTSAVSSEDFEFPIRLQRDEEPSLEDLMDDALDAADAPGNRSSIRSPLPPQWRATEFSRTMSSRGIRQQEASRSTEFLPLPSAVLSSDLGYLPNLSAPRSVPIFAVASSRPGTARVDGDDGGDGA